MPLDTGTLAEVHTLGMQERAIRRPRVSLDSKLSVGAALKAARESLGLTLDDIAEVTRVRPTHLQAIEVGALDRLPSRPYAIGYARAYAKALNADADAVAGRFRAEHPNPDDELRTPVGVKPGGLGRSRLLMGVGFAAVVALVGWNVARHAMAQPPSPRAAAAAAAAPHFATGKAPPATGAYSLGAPLPAPPEATTPEPYQTPGLAAASAAGGSADAANAAQAKAAGVARAASNSPQSNPTTAGTPFAAQGAVYGPTAGASAALLQAIKPISLEVRGAGGVVYFARQLAAGEAYRLPALAGLSVEVSNPANTAVFLGGVSHGVLTDPITPVSKITG